jgi:hypothetical protein
VAGETSMIGADARAPLARSPHPREQAAMSALQGEARRVVLILERDEDQNSMLKEHMRPPE